MALRSPYSAPVAQVILLASEDVLADSYRDGGDGIIIDFAGDMDGRLFNLPTL